MKIIWHRAFQLRFVMMMMKKKSELMPKEEDAATKHQQKFFFNVHLCYYIYHNERKVYWSFFSSFYSERQQYVHFTIWHAKVYRYDQNRLFTCSSPL